MQDDLPVPVLNGFNFNTYAGTVNAARQARPLVFGGTDQKLEAGTAHDFTVFNAGSIAAGGYVFTATE